MCGCGGFMILAKLVPVLTHIVTGAVLARHQGLTAMLITHVYTHQQLRKAICIIICIFSGLKIVILDRS